MSRGLITARLGGMLPPSHGQGHLMLPKLASLGACRSMPLLAVLARGDAAKDLRAMEPAAATTTPMR